MEKKYQYTKISVYCDKDEMIRWGKIARKQGKKLSDYARECIIEKERLFDKIDTTEKPPAQDTPEVAELIAENKSLKEQVSALQSQIRQQEAFDESKILDCLSKTEWKNTGTIAMEAGVYSPNISLQLKAAKNAGDWRKEQELIDIVFKGSTEVEMYLVDLQMNTDGVESKKDKAGNRLWRLK